MRNCPSGEGEGVSPDIGYFLYFDMMIGITQIVSE